MPEAPLIRVRRICLALPEATEKVAWGAPTFRVRDKKMFAIYAEQHHGDPRIALWVNAPEGAQQVLTGAEPRTFFVPPYVGPKGWLAIDLAHVGDARIVDCVRQAYRMVAPKKLQALLGPDPG